MGQGIALLGFISRKKVHTQTLLNFPMTSLSYTFQLLLVYCFLCVLTSAFLWRLSGSEGPSDGSDLVNMMIVLRDVRPSSLVGGSSGTMIPHHNCNFKFYLKNETDFVE